LEAYQETVFHDRLHGRSHHRNQLRSSRNNVGCRRQHLVFEKHTLRPVHRIERLSKSRELDAFCAQSGLDGIDGREDEVAEKAKVRLGLGVGIGSHGQN
jgi:hypothetical protein